MTAPGDDLGSTARRIMLGAGLRRLREGCSVTQEEAGRAIYGSASKISTLEHGKASVKISDVTELLALYGVPEGHARDALLKMARYANVPGWWERYSDVMPGWFRTYVALEAAASQIRTYESQFIPGLLQTEAYSQAVTSHGRSSRTAKQVGRRVRSRRERQRILAKSETVLWAVIDEGALHRPMGGREVMRQQLEELLCLIEQRRNIIIQVLPFAIGCHRGEVGAFSVLRFKKDVPDSLMDELPDIVYLEHLTGALYLEKIEEVEQYRKVFGQLIVDAQEPGESASTIRKIIASL